MNPRALIFRALGWRRGVPPRNGVYWTQDADSKLGCQEWVCGAVNWPGIAYAVWWKPARGPIPERLVRLSYRGEDR